MQKQFTVNIPDELWVDSWEDELTATYTYNGPENFYLGVDDNNSILYIKHGDLDSEAEPFTEEEAAKYNWHVTVDANVNPEFAWFLYHQDEEEYVHEDIVNHNGSIYQKITNPALREYYTLDCRFVEGSTETKELFLAPLYKDLTIAFKTIANQRLAVVKKYNTVYDFDVEDQTKIDSFISNMETYISSLASAYPWKYVEIDVTEIPKIPASLQLLFNQLPEID